MGDGGTIIEYDGVSWTADVSATAETLYGIWGSPNPGILAVGSNGTVRLGYRGATLDPLDAARFGHALEQNLRGMKDSIEGPLAFAEKRRPNFEDA